MIFLKSEKTCVDALLAFYILHFCIWVEQAEDEDELLIGDNSQEIGMWGFSILRQESNATCFKAEC